MLAGHAAIGRPVRELSTLFIMVTRSCLNSSGIIKEIFSFPLNFFMKWFPDHLWALISGHIWATSFIDPISFCTCFSSTFSQSLTASCDNFVRFFFSQKPTHVLAVISNSEYRSSCDQLKSLLSCWEIWRQRNLHFLAKLSHLR